jgi:hypothetical protein
MRKLATALMAVALLILAGLTAALVSPASHIRVPALANLITICALMLAAMGGVEAGLALGHPGPGLPTAGLNSGRGPILALLFSVVPILGGFAVLWLPSTSAQLTAAIILFAIAFAIDVALHHMDLLPWWFLKLRVVATLLACATLGVALWLA